MHVPLLTLTCTAWPCFTSIYFFFSPDCIIRFSSQKEKGEGGMYREERRVGMGSCFTSLRVAPGGTVQPQHSLRAEFAL